MINDSVVVVIPTNRLPPIKTLQNHKTKYPVMVIADPDVAQEHLAFAKENGLHFTIGKKGRSPQIAHSYRLPYIAGWEWAFRLDDDLDSKVFIHKDKGKIPQLDEVIEACLACALKTKTSLAGIANTTNRYWMSEGFGRSFGLIHGAAQIYKTTPNPEEFVDERVQYFEDVYRSLSHRKKDGAVGRVKYIGFDKQDCSGRVEQAMNEQLPDIEIILETFPGMVEFDGFKQVNNGKYTVPNWRWKR